MQTEKRECGHATPLYTSLVVPAPQVRLHDDAFTLEPLQPGQIMAEKYIRWA